MKTRMLVSYGVVFAVALAAGMMLDRFLLPEKKHAQLQPQPAETKTESMSGAAPVESGVVPEAIATLPDSPAPVAARPTKSLDAILAERDPRQRITDLEAFINALSPGEYANALKRIAQMAGNNERELASRLLVARWVQADRDGALKFAEDNRGFEYIADHVFEQLAAENVPSAWSEQRRSRTMICVTMRCAASLASSPALIPRARFSSHRISAIFAGTSHSARQSTGSGRKVIRKPHCKPPRSDRGTAGVLQLTR